MFWTILLCLLFAFFAIAIAPMPGKGYTMRAVGWLWRIVAWTASRPLVADWLIQRQNTICTTWREKDGMLELPVRGEVS